MSLTEQPESFSLDELTFCKPPPEYLEMECPICLLVMLHEPCLVSCCGHHFCRYCIEKAKRSNSSCPYCKKENYDVMADKGLDRVIKSLRVKCIECNQGCPWEGGITDLVTHINKDKRDGDCVFTEVECKNSCGVKQQRVSLPDHEMSSCDKRPYRCEYCSYKSTFIDVTTEHRDSCLYYPIHCPNACQPDLVLERRLMNVHVKDECPLTVLSCDFKDDGCGWKGERRDHVSHGFRDCPKHLKMVHKKVIKLEEDNISLRKEIDELKTLMKKAASEMRRQSKEIEKQQEHIKSLQTRTTTHRCH